MNDNMLDLGGMKRRIGQALFVLFAIGALYLLVLVALGVKEYGRGPNPMQNSITVTGEGEAVAIPDTAVFSFSVTEEAKTVAEAQEMVTEKVAEAMEFLEKNDIEERDIKTTSYNIYPKYEYQAPVVCNQFSCPPYREPEISGYEVSQETTVKVREVETAGDLLSGIGAVGVKNLSGLSFVVDDEDAVQAEAQEKAIADAKAKAEVLADSLGVRLVRIISFYENSGAPYPMYYSKDAAMGMGGAEASVAPRAAEVSPGENKYLSNVNITYEIR